METLEDDLANHLRSFGKRFVEAHPFEKLMEMLATGENTREYHNESDVSKYFEVAASPMYSGSDEYGEYVAVLFNVMDRRAKGKLGSAYTPMSCFGFVHASGHVEFGPIGNGAVAGKGYDF